MRNVIYDKSEYLFEKASLSYLKYSNKLKIEELFNIKKAVYNSKNPESYMSWERVKILCKTNERFDEVVVKLSSFSKFNVLDYSFNEFRDIIVNKKENNDELFKYFKGNDLTSLFHSIFTERNVDINANNLPTALVVNRGVDYCKIYDGEIYVPVSDDDIIFLKKYSKGVCRILDGGICKIVGVFDEDCDYVPNFEEEDYISVNTINREKICDLK